MSVMTDSSCREMCLCRPSAVIKQKDAVVLGAASTWLGRISLSVPGEPQPVFTYFKGGMPASGWTLTSSSFSKTSLPTFTKGERVANIRMQGINFGGNDVLMTVAPAARPVTSRPRQAQRATKRPCLKTYRKPSRCRFLSLYQTTSGAARWCRG